MIWFELLRVQNENSQFLVELMLSFLKEKKVNEIETITTSSLGFIDVR